MYARLVTGSSGGRADTARRCVPRRRFRLQQFAGAPQRQFSKARRRIWCRRSQRPGRPRIDAAERENQRAASAGDRRCSACSTSPRPRWYGKGHSGRSDCLANDVSSIWVASTSRMAAGQRTRNRSHWHVRPLRRVSRRRLRSCGPSCATRNDLLVSRRSTEVVISTSSDNCCSHQGVARMVKPSRSAGRRRILLFATILALGAFRPCWIPSRRRHQPRRFRNVISR